MTERSERRHTALVTGASRGIGRAIALRLSATHDIAAAARTRAELDSLARDITSRGGSCQPIELDVADAQAVARALANVNADVLINNAGVGFLKPFLELSPEEWNTMVDVNFNALFHVTRAVLPGMIERGYGHIVMVGSIAGRSAFVGGSCYAATKHAVMGFSESLMLEVRDRGVKVSVVNPGSVATSFSRRERDTSWMLTADDVADAVAHAIDTPPRVLVHRIEVRAAAPKKG
jgi:NADP-dependent 3-hydroxy acid dehydrogenase YdfG